MALPTDFHLTKSYYVTGVSCPKLLWTKLNRPHMLPELDDSAKLRMEQGTEVGVLARDLYTDALGIMTKNTGLALSLTDKYLGDRKPMYEAAFQTIIEGVPCLARVDILNPVGKDSWELIEVKSGTRVKDENYHDVAFQLHVLESAGINVHQCSLMHINNEYVLDGKLNLEEFLIKENITEELAPYLDAVQENVTFLKDMLLEKKPPELICAKPKDCPACERVLPEHSVFDLFYGGKIAHELWEKGIKTIDKIPATAKLSAKQHVQQSALLSQQTQLRRKPITQYLDALQYPLYMLDFESFSEAIPRLQGTHPYQQIPFQYSIHIVEEDGNVKHIEYLAPSENDDPRPALYKQLKDDLKDAPMILAYHAPFEKKIIKELAQAFPKFATAANDLLPKIGDLADPFKEFYIYHPSQHGKYSIKYVLPAFTDVSYDSLDINNGALASAKFLESITTDPQTKQTIRDDLLKYCKQDTAAMVAILDVLKNL